MSSPEESPVQQAARRRRERREAKLKADGSARLDKITGGRIPPGAHESSLPPRPASPPVVNPELASQSSPTSTSPLPPAPSVEDPLPEDILRQQEYIREMLRAHPPEQQSQAQSQPNEDPTMKLLSAMLGGLPSSDSSTAENVGGPGGLGGLSPSDLASAVGLPPFLTKLLLGNGPATEEEKRQEWIWKLLHILFALVVGWYLILLLGSSVATYGSQPPPPPTVQNPLVIFITGELLLSGMKILLSVGRNGQLAELSIWLQLLRNLSRDGSIALFMFGLGSWWRGGWRA
ncbi:hypothetical protein V8E54_011551 [Elaphomyces granulatus]